MEHLNVIDLITYNDKEPDPRVVLHLYVDSDWSTLNRDVKAVIARLERYYHFVSSGQLDGRPGYRGQKIGIHLVCLNQMPPGAASVLSEVGKWFESNDIELSIGHDRI